MLDPWVGRIPWRRKWQPTPVFWPGEPHGQRSLADCSPWGCKESDTAECACGLTRTHTYMCKYIDSQAHPKPPKLESSGQPTLWLLCVPGKAFMDIITYVIIIFYDHVGIKTNIIQTFWNKSKHSIPRLRKGFCTLCIDRVGGSPRLRGSPLPSSGLRELCGPGRWCRRGRPVPVPALRELAASGLS